MEDFNIYLISYDLKKPGRNYSELYDEIKRNGEWKHPLESVWIIKTRGGENVSQISNRLREKMDSNDTIFVVDITKRECDGWLSKTFWQWLYQ